LKQIWKSKNAPIKNRRVFLLPNNPANLIETVIALRFGALLKKSARA
jgi:hypothetical protein